jgi:hypothetical protein
VVKTPSEPLQGTAIESEQDPPRHGGPAPPAEGAAYEARRARESHLESEDHVGEGGAISRTARG